MRNVGSAAAALFLCFSTTVLAQGPPTGGPPTTTMQTVINNAIATNSTLHVVGQNLCTSPSVKLNGATVTPSNATTSSFDIPVAGVAPGSYLLTISCGTAANLNDAFDVTLGAVGPQGPQGPPGPQGIQGPPGPSSAPPVQNVLDRNDIVVGAVVGTPGVAAATIRYSVLGDSVLLNATSSGLSNFGVPIQPGFSPSQAKVFFTTSDCSGDAYLNFNTPGSNPTSTLTPRQAIVLGGLFFSPLPPPIPGSSCPQPAGGNWLYVTDRFACPVSNFTGPLGLLAYYGFPGGATGSCSPMTGGEPTGTYQVYHRTDDLASKFTPPLYVP